MKKIYNFSAGPSMLPIDVMTEAKKNFKYWNNLSYSIMEISHRSSYFLDMIEEAESNLRELLNIPDHYKILFTHGGARGQFSVIPMNLLHNNNYADYICSGYWSQAAATEAKKYCIANEVHVINDINNKIVITPMKNWKIHDSSCYVHYCFNETISGLAIYDIPNWNNKFVICDCSSSLLSQTINIEDYSLIYASAQKNIGLSGITLIIIREDLIGLSKQNVPSILDYHYLFMNQSMFNTPSTYSWYICSLVFKWLKNLGGIEVIEKINKEKAHHLYHVIDNSDFYVNDIHPDNRSIMNVVFRLKNPFLEPTFLQQSTNIGLLFLNNHKILGGIRASIYNSMPLCGVKKLAKFMKNFEKKYG
ncbi:MAG: 3-phosphoserine/phosphohydroxythreonine transaminase [Buchnera aphidicola (Eriosoma harunire)]